MNVYSDLFEMDSQQFTTQDWYLNDRTGLFEEYTQEVGDSIQIINEKEYAESLISTYSEDEMLKNKIRTIINTDDEVFGHRIINELASCLLFDNFLFNFDRLWNTTQSKSVEDLIVTLVEKFDNTIHNMAYLSSCLICIFREITKKSTFPAVEMKFKLTVFVDVVRKYINHIDYAMWKSWFLCDMFLDWCFFVASIFIPKNNFVRVEKQYLINVTEYFEMVRNYRYIFSNNSISEETPKPASGIFEPTKSDFGDVKVITLEESKCIQIERRRIQHTANTSRKTNHSKSAAGRKKTQRRKFMENPIVEKKRKRKY